MPLVSSLLVTDSQITITRKSQIFLLDFVLYFLITNCLAVQRSHYIGHYIYLISIHVAMMKLSVYICMELNVDGTASKLNEKPCFYM